MLRVAAVEGGVEAGDLRHVRVDPSDDADRRRGCAAGAAAPAARAREPGEDGGVDEDRPVEVGAAVDDAVADGAELDAAEGRKPAAESPRWRRAGRGTRRRPTSRSTRVAPSASVARSRGLDADAVDLAADLAVEARRDDVEELELEARGAGVDDEDQLRIRPGTAALAGARWRRAPRPRRRRGGCGRCRRAR